MTTNQRAARRARGAGLLLLLAAAGCGGPRLYPVHGKVAYPDGSPMLGGAVMFEPVPNPLNVMAQAALDNQTGEFRLTTYKEGDGAMPGLYRVIVRPRRPNPKSQTVDPALLNQLHPRFMDFATSGLEFTVEPKDNEFVITVERERKPGG